MEANKGTKDSLTELVREKERERWGKHKGTARLYVHKISHEIVFKKR